MECNRTIFTEHALQRIFARGLAQADILHVVRAGETIESYPPDTPYPSHLMLGYVNSVPLHVVVARDDATTTCVIVTAYLPDPLRWSADFRRRLP